jgi:hypothetical protein|tara:strand:+ start:650 stop:766 length:117 start_codon:yes stop_codon:yes gene_type:complete
VFHGLTEADLAVGEFLQSRIFHPYFRIAEFIALPIKRG